MPFMQNQQINTFAANNLSGYNNLGNRMSNNPNAYQQIPMAPASGALIDSGLVNNQSFMNNISPFASANPSSAMMANMGFNQGNQYTLTPQQQQTPHCAEYDAIKYPRRKKTSNRQYNVRWAKRRKSLMANLQELIPAIFTGPNGERLTPEQIAQRQQVAQSLIGRATDTSPDAGGWASVLTKGLLGFQSGRDRRAADNAITANAAAEQSLISDMLGSLGGGAGFNPAVAAGGFTYIRCGSW
ncbi:hypothetical protein [Brucella phage EF4]|uniref:Uncharacterized protein n=1 Tax=Brucella phage EF4 TaxID=2706778 RepID=A0A6C0X264_9CAUD|nr:hypothetical protein [Brucella phage EF4]